MHTTHVKYRTNGLQGRFQPYCNQCGAIGPGERYEQDAIAIADRHQPQQVDGFETIS